MSARARLVEALKNPGLVGLRDEEAAELIDAFALEVWAHPVNMMSSGVVPKAGDGASLPRPDEEPTP